MALSIRLRRAFALSSSLLKDRHFSAVASSSPPLFPPKLHSSLVGNPSPRTHSLIHAQFFRSSSAVFNRDRGFDQNEPEIGPDDILFEGCDYNHWLITIDFPKDPAPTREEMIETYVETAAKVFGSEEEAKKKIYACSTTTYQGFQVICDEATSEKFQGLPGVVFILPDSYIDPVNKEYGGDKYENGIITPRPPPIQYGSRGRYGDRNRNRNYDQPRYNRPMDSVPQDGRGFGPPPQDGRGYGPPPPRQDGRGYGPPPPPPQDGRGYGPPPPPPQDGRGYGPPPPLPQDRRGYGPPPPPPQDGRGYGPPPPPQDGRGYGPPPPPPQYGRGYGPPPQQDGRGYGPAPPQDRRAYNQPPQDEKRYASPPLDGRGSDQGERRDQVPYQSGMHQGQPGNVFPSEQRNISQGPDYAGEYTHGPGFDHGSSSSGPAEGQWQAKY